MRSERFIENTSPCDTDYRDKSLQSLGDVRGKGQVFCPNLAECKRRSVKENIHCSLKHARIMASHIAASKEKGLKEFMLTIKNEKKKFLRFAPKGRYWVSKDGIWEVVRNKEKGR